MKVPTLGIHETEDSVLPDAHAEALLKTIPHARPLPLEGRGHELHFQDRDLIIGAIIPHIQAEHG
jgi:pimeloyl-ACP methyl ester carboxylesterase